jgi:hypothetical protein
MLRKERDLKIVVSKFKYPTATCRFGGPGSSMKKKPLNLHVSGRLHTVIVKQIKKKYKRIVELVAL